MNWVKANTGAAYLILHTGAEGLTMITHMEGGGDRVTGNSFRILEGIYVPEDYVKIVDKVRSGDAITTARMREIATEVLSERWWTWVLLHPDLPDDKVHPSRSMQWVGFMFHRCTVFFIKKKREQKKTAGFLFFYRNHVNSTLTCTLNTPPCFLISPCRNTG